MIIDPNYPHDRKVPIQLFNIGQLLASKVPNSSCNQFKAVLWYANKLKKHQKYDISMDNHESKTDQFEDNMAKLKNNFLQEQESV